MVGDGEKDDYTDGEFAKFQQLVWDSKIPLNPGCEEKKGNFTKMLSVLKLLKLNATHYWSDRSFTELLELLCEMLLEGNFTKMLSVLKLLKLNATHYWSDRSFTELLELLCEM